jgi:hypothetical protein
MRDLAEEQPWELSLGRWRARRRGGELRFVPGGSRAGPGVELPHDWEGRLDSAVWGRGEMRGWGKSSYGPSEIAWPVLGGLAGRPL